jgi:hypothetical protein
VDREAADYLDCFGKEDETLDAEEGTPINCTPYAQFVTRISKVWYVPEVITFASVIEAETNW